MFQIHSQSIYNSDTELHTKKVYQYMNFVVYALRVYAPDPGSMFTTPFGNFASAVNSANLRAVKGVT